MRMTPLAAAGAALWALTALASCSGAPAPEGGGDAPAEAAPASGDGGPPPVSDFASTAMRPPGATDVTESEGLASLACPDTPLEFRITYPQGMDGGGPVDQTVGRRARGFQDNLKGNLDDLVGPNEGCGGLGDAYLRVTGRPYVISSKAYSVLYVYESRGLDVLEPVFYEAVNLHADGSPITVPALFPDTDLSRPFLWGLLYMGFCAQGAAEGHATAPRFYGGQPCGPEPPPVPPGMELQFDTLYDLGGGLLTSLGLSIHLDPSQAWGEDGHARHWLDIPKRELLHIGADPRLWD